MRDCLCCLGDQTAIHKAGTHACWWWERDGQNYGLDILTGREAHGLTAWFENRWA